MSNEASFIDENEINRSVVGLSRYQMELDLILKCAFGFALRD